MAGNTSVPGATVGSRLLAVLDCFDVDHRELTLTGIAQRAELPLSTARRLITELILGKLEVLDKSINEKSAV
ncbi:helix-turn-helix domain-containing protein [Mycolicibacterium goodii]|uniref:helix-turn-helix domain-containing protein n=1 Tax=Mycolicibacterium goodii TaxID=134601 RepID=UPI0035580800